MHKNKLRDLILLLLLLLLPCSSWCRKNDCPSLIFQCGYKYLRITGVEQTDSATTVNLRCSLPPGKTFTLPQEDLYLSDEQQNIHRLLSAEGINLTEKNISPFTGETDFSLAFEPLADDVEFFDLLSNNVAGTGFAFWGVHSNTKSLKKIKSRKDVVCLREEGFLLLDTATIIGRFPNYLMPENPDTLQIVLRQPIVNKLAKDECYSVPVSNDGSFLFRVPIGNRTWAYIRNEEYCNIPVFMTPADTLFLTIEKPWKPDMKVDYTSAKGYDVMSKLMKADCHYSEKWVDWNKDYHPAELKETAYNGMKETARLADYISWKYDLSTVENHLLQTRIKSVWQRLLIFKQDDYFSKVFFRKGGSYLANYVDSVRARPEVDAAYSFLNEVNASDYTYFLLPRQLLMNDMSLMSPITHCRSTEESRNKMIKLLGQPMEKEWERRLRLPDFTRHY